MMRRLLGAPGVSALLFVAWLMLARSASTGQLLLAALFALAIPWIGARLAPQRPRIRSWTALLRLAAVVSRDIVVCNFDVARRILGRQAAVQPRFVWVPLSIRDAHGIVSLAGIITLTPGTLSSELTEDRRHLLVHALHCPDDTAAAALVAEIKARYEAPLMEIFE